ncbi:MAG: 23S rRNA (uracil(1939)-C(5))-methyltransferase RlmD [Erysipelotrichaceae bacterium]|nr:23S rRNA (uracil(1939)-C(5))-methyltransferase RlmD [Erysipelotrichaceae bacterium]
MQKNQLFTGTCTDYTYNGLGVVKYDTFCVFVKDMITGETGEIVITAVRKDYGYGRLLKLIEPSPERVEARCPISRQCGGCQLQHMSQKGQAEFKQRHVEHTLRNIGKVTEEIKPIIMMDEPYRYRNKVILPLTVNKDGLPVTGFYRYNSHEVIPVDECYLQSEQANELVRKIRLLMYRHDIHEHVRYVMLRDLPKTGEIMVALVTDRRDVRGIDRFTEDLVKGNEHIKSVIQNINEDKKTNVVLGKSHRLLYGSWHLTDELCGLKFEISDYSFYQINTVQTEVLYGKAIELAQLKKTDLVLDLYCGVGTIGLIASKKAGRVIGVEIVEEAIKDAKRNAEINGITNVNFICGDSQKMAADFAREEIRPDVIFVDPPRKGCSEETLESIVTMKPERLVYVSCNPSTLARDLYYLKNNGYEIREIQPVDQFPHTYHVETVCCLYHQRKDFISVPYEPKNVE